MNLLKKGIDKMRALHRKNKINKIRREKITKSMNDFKANLVKWAKETVEHTTGGMKAWSDVTNPEAINRNKEKEQIFAGIKTMSGTHFAHNLEDRIIAKVTKAIFYPSDKFTNKKNHVSRGDRIRFENNFGEITDSFEYNEDDNIIRVLPTDAQKEIGNEKQRDLTTSNAVAEYLNKLKTKYQVPGGTAYLHREIVLAHVNDLLNWAKNNQN